VRPGCDRSVITGQGLFRYSGVAGLGAPVRFCVSQRDGEDTRIDIDRPASIPPYSGVQASAVGGECGRTGPRGLVHRVAGRCWRLSPKHHGSTCATVTAWKLLDCVSCARTPPISSDAWRTARKSPLPWPAARAPDSCPRSLEPGGGGPTWSNCSPVPQIPPGMSTVKRSPMKCVTRGRRSESSSRHQRGNRDRHRAP
jgi:hypothetical protein